MSNPSTSPAMDSQPPKPTTEYKIYTRRWYIILMMGWISFCQSYLWAVFGSISGALKAVFGWDHIQIALIPFYGTAFNALFSMPSTWFLHRFGLRKLMITMSALVASSCVLRCIPGSNTSITVLANLAGLLNALAGIVTMFLAPAISARWFPPNERRLATAVGSLLNGLGIAVSFLGGSVLVSDPSTGASVEDMRQDYFYYTYAHTAATVCSFIAILIYYPDAPPTPPSESAEVQRVSIIEGIKQLVGCVDFWLVALPFVVIFGVGSGFTPVLSIDLKENHNVTQTSAAWIGFASGTISFFVGVGSGQLADVVGHLKMLQIGACLLVLLGAVWLLLILKNYITFTLLQAYFSNIIGTVGLNVLLPVNFELSAEILYPIDEAVVVGLIGSLCNVVAAIYLAILFFPVDTSWLNWAYVGATVLALPLAVGVREQYNRSKVDASNRRASVMTL